jgi:hypothetical protein
MGVVGWVGVTPGVGARGVVEGCVGVGATYGRGGAADLEPRLPTDPPPPTRAQASACKAQALKNKQAKRIRKPFSHFLAIMFSSGCT